MDVSLNLCVRLFAAVAGLSALPMPLAASVAAETVDGLRTLCITDREDVCRTVKQIQENTIHAFDMASDGEKHPEASAMVAVWARTNADDTRNDYGNPQPCQSAAEPDTPARRGAPLRCELRQMKY